MARLPVPILVAIAVAVAMGCHSGPPPRFYTLEAVAPEGAIARDGAIAPVKVNAVHVPPLLDRREIVRGEADSRVEISSEDRWGSDFGEMARNILTQNLQQRLPPGTVIPPNVPAPANARSVVVEIQSFAPNESGQVVLVCDWTLLEGTPPHPVFVQTVNLAATDGVSASGQVSAMSRLLGKLADQIAASIESGAHGAG